MSILASLTRAYYRLDGVPSFGYSTEKIGYVISLNDDGTVAETVSLAIKSGNKKIARVLQVPQPAKRTSGISPNFLWDNTCSVLGIADENLPEDKRLNKLKRHEAFVELHCRVLKDSDDKGLKALYFFLQSWSPSQFVEAGFPDDMRDKNVVFCLESERLNDIYIHNRPASKELWARLSESGDNVRSVCLITGAHAPVARLHASIKGVRGARPSGASIVSFKLDASKSYGHEQGDNAPVSRSAEFAYRTALNKFLGDSRHRIQIGDASTVFWADASNAETSKEAEGVFASLFADGVDEAMQATRVGEILCGIRDGRPLEDLSPELAKGVRFYVLGLAPNAARISIRFWLENDFGTIAANYQRFVDDMRVEPKHRDEYPALWKYLVEFARKSKTLQQTLKNIPPTLAGDWMCSILTGRSYPSTLLSQTLMRIRADKEINALRVGVLRAVLVRNFGMGEVASVALDVNNKNKGYLLGRLFATYEYAQVSAFDSKINATIKDKFYGAASAQPRKVFALLEKGSAAHLSKIGKEKLAFRISLEHTIGGIMEVMSPDDDPFPASLSAREQALFGLGYYHQKNIFYRSKLKTSSKEDTE